MDPLASARIASAADPARPRPTLGLRAAIALIVGVVIGAGTFKAPSIVAALSPSAEAMFGLWLLGGLVSLAGALCYAELATAYPHAGGDYHFLRRAYGRSLAFLFGWARFSVITTGSIALLGFVFGDYLQQVLPFPLGPPGAGPGLYAASIIVVLTLVNLGGIRAGDGGRSLGRYGCARGPRAGLPRQGDGLRAAHLRRLERSRLHQRRSARRPAQHGQGPGAVGPAHHRPVPAGGLGLRVVSHAFDMGPDWPPEKTASVDGRSTYYWTITQVQKRKAKA